MKPPSGVLCETSPFTSENAPYCAVWRTVAASAFDPSDPKPVPHRPRLAESPLFRRSRETLIDNNLKRRPAPDGVTPIKGLFGDNSRKPHRARGRGRLGLSTNHPTPFDFPCRPCPEASSSLLLRRDNAPVVPSPYFAEIGTIVVTGFACVGLFSSPPEASAPCDELDTTAIVIRSFVLSGVFLGEPVLRASAEKNS